MAHNYRQEVFNVILAQLLQERGVVSAPEDVLKSAAYPNRKMPDILVDYSGLRTAIEGEVDDQPDYALKAIGSARNRVEQGIAHIGIAVVYPATLRAHDFSKLKNELQKCELRIAVVTEGGESNYSQGNVNQLAELLRRTFNELVQEDVVSKAVATLEGGIEKFASIVATNPGTVLRLADLLGIRELPKREKKDIPEDEE